MLKAKVGDTIIFNIEDGHGTGGIGRLTTVIREKLEGYTIHHHHIDIYLAWGMPSLHQHKVPSDEIVVNQTEIVAVIEDADIGSLKARLGDIERDIWQLRHRVDEITKGEGKVVARVLVDSLLFGTTSLDGGREDAKK